MKISILELSKLTKIRRGAALAPEYNSITTQKLSQKASNGWKKKHVLTVSLKAYTVYADGRLLEVELGSAWTH